MNKRSEIVILLEAMNEQMKMMKRLISMLYTQYPAEPGDPVKINILTTLNNPKVQELQEKIDKCITQVKKLKPNYNRVPQQPRR